MNTWTALHGQQNSEDAFYSCLTKTSISDSDYGHSQRVFTELKCEDMGDNHDSYLLADVILLADIFVQSTKYKQTSLHFYKLDPAHYVSTLGMTWDAFLKFSRVWPSR